MINFEKFSKELEFEDNLNWLKTHPVNEMTEYDVKFLLNAKFYQKIFAKKFNKSDITFKTTKTRYFSEDYGMWEYLDPKKKYVEIRFDIARNRSADDYLSFKFNSPYLAALFMIHEYEHYMTLVNLTQMSKDLDKNIEVITKYALDNLNFKTKTLFMNKLDLNYFFTPAKKSIYYSPCMC